MSSLVAGAEPLSMPEEQFRRSLATTAGQPRGLAISLLRRLGRPHRLSAFLRELTDDDRRTSAVAARSHRHPLGFDKFILATFGELGQLRMHVWWPEQVRKREHVHNHRFHFASAVVIGQLACHYYRAADGGQRLLQFRESSRSEDSAWRFEAVGFETVSETLTVHLTAGSSYSMSEDLLHRVNATSTTTVTLMLQGRSSRDWSSVLVGAEGQLPERLERRCFEPDELRCKLATLGHHLAGQG
ncbi:hypothetical protein ABZU25_01875 [Micromonospora sp. NPDC005215]|uniref:hypothetical protein n=1 Tax=Micromonospora sp. NPDC005215 TaxID=3157024 RepID=UPI0033A7363E